MYSVGDTMEASGFRPGDRALWLTVLALLAGAGLSYAARCAPPEGMPRQACPVLEARTAIDGWVGRWEVYVDHRRRGRDLVTTAASGCALDYRRIDPRGVVRRSVLVFDPLSGAWSTVGLTPDLRSPRQRVRMARLSPDQISRITEESANGVEWRLVMAEVLVRNPPLT